MVKNYFKVLLVLCFSVTFGAYVANAQTTITEWTFDNETLLPATGTGTAANFGGTTTAYASGETDGRAWNTSTYPEQGAGSGTAGAQFTVSTAGYNDVSVSWTNRMSNTAANRIRLQYTLNGTDWINFEASDENATNTRDGVNKGFDNGTYIADTGTVWYHRSANLTGIAEINNNPQFAVRLVTEFADGTDQYGAANPASSYSPNGTVRIDNVIFTGGTGNSPLITATPGNLSGFTYLVGTGPSDSQPITLSGNNLTPESGDITVTAPASYEVSVDGANFTNTLTISYSGSSFTDETILVRLKGDLGAGTYNETLNITGGGAGPLNLPLSGNVSSGLEPTLSGVILPQYIQGSVPTDTLRVPYAWFATITNLTPNSTYRYYNRVVLSTESETSTGAGNIILVNTTEKTFKRISSPNLGVDGSYGVFTTDANGSYNGWFMTEPTNNATRFIPGTYLLMRIILNDGNNGTQPVTYLTTADSLKVINWGTAATDISGTGFIVISPFTEKNFVFVYDNVEGTGRPIYGTQVEASGVDFSASGSYAEFYEQQVGGKAHYFGGIVPNVNPNGIRRFEERSISDGSIVNANYTSSTGNWGDSGGVTANPGGGVEDPLILQLVLGLPELTEKTGNIYSYGQTLYVNFNENTSAEIILFDLTGKQAAKLKMEGTKDSFQLNQPEGIYLLKITTDKGSFSKKLYLK